MRGQAGQRLAQRLVGIRYVRLSLSIMLRLKTFRVLVGAGNLEVTLGNSMFGGVLVP